MKFAKVILLTAAVTLLVVFLLGLVGLVINTLKFFFWVAVFVVLMALIVKLLKGLKGRSQPTSSYDPKELESWDKMFDDYKQSTKQYREP